MTVRRWWRKADSDLIERMEAGHLPGREPKPIPTPKRHPRHWDTYRAVRRNMYNGWTYKEVK